MTRRASVDLDGVIFRQGEAFVPWSNKHGWTELTLEAYTDDWALLWQGADPDEIERRKRQWFASPEFAALQAVEGLAQGLAVLNERFDEVVGVTSRRAYLRDVTLGALEAVAPGALSRVYFATYLIDGYGKVEVPKGEILAHLRGVAVHIDDQPLHCLSARRWGMKAVLFGDYPWSGLERPVRGIEPAQSWHDVSAALDRLGFSAR